LIRRSTWNAVRRLVLVVVEPDDAQLQLLIRLLARLQTRPDAPMHLIVVQEQPRNAGHELYALLPALITSGGQGSGGGPTWPEQLAEAWYGALVCTRDAYRRAPNSAG